MNRLIINAVFPGDPQAWQRVSGHGSRVFKPKETRKAQAALVRGLKCVAPQLKPDSRSRFGVQVVFSTRSFRKDADNCFKLLADAFNRRIWQDDAQIDEVQITMKRGAITAQTHFVCYTIN